jgi:hypothetical protein
MRVNMVYFMKKAMKLDFFLHEKNPQSKILIMGSIEGLKKLVFKNFSQVIVIKFKIIE